MPAKKKAEAKAEEPTPKQDKALAVDKADATPNDRRAAIDAEADAAVAATNADRDAAAALQAQSQAALINQPKKVKADPNGDIDQRMQALLEDHQEMGVRPK